MANKEDTLRGVFHVLDTKKKGSIGKDEIIAVLSPLLPDIKEKIGEYMQEYGKNPEDRITEKEFIERLIEAPTKLNIPAQFLYIAKDKGEKVKLEDIEEFAKASGEEEDDVLDIKDELKMVDSDHDGYVNYDEFATMIMNVKKG